VAPPPVGKLTLQRRDLVLELGNAKLRYFLLRVGRPYPKNPNTIIAAKPRGCALSAPRLLGRTTRFHHPLQGICPQRRAAIQRALAYTLDGSHSTSTETL